jgi:AcrR family transcriptional regulator
VIQLPASSGATGAAAGKRKFNEVKWQQILQAAAETFAAKGYEATSIRDVADSVGMLGGSLYYYIKTKEDLLYALIDDFHRVGMEEVERAEQEAVAAGHGDDPLALLRAVCQRHAEVNLRSRTLSAVFYNDFRYLSSERKEHIVESRRSHQHRIEELISLAQEAGEISRDLDPRLCALAMLSLLNATNTWYQPDKDASGQSVPEFLSSLLIDGLSGASVAKSDARIAVPAPSKRTNSRSKPQPPVDGQVLAISRNRKKKS